MHIILPPHDPDKINKRTTACNQRRPASNIKVKCLKSDKGNRRQNALMGGFAKRLYQNIYRLMASTLLQCGGTVEMSHLDQFNRGQVHGNDLQGCGGKFLHPLRLDGDWIVFKSVQDSWDENLLRSSQNSLHDDTFKVSHYLFQLLILLILCESLVCLFVFCPD